MTEKSSLTFTAINFVVIAIIKVIGIRAALKLEEKSLAFVAFSENTMEREMERGGGRHLYESRISGRISAIAALL